MKRAWIFGLILVFLTACGESESQFTDNGNPGQIQITVFYDDNGNGQMDAGEEGASSRVAIAQEVSCPPSSDPAWLETEADGSYTYQALQPGRYCVFFESNGMAVTTKMTQDVFVSSDQVTTVHFGRGR